MFERMADVNANLIFVADVLATVVVSDGIDMRPDVVALIFCDRCCHLCICLVTDVVVTFEVEVSLADVIANVVHFNCCKVTYHG